MKKIMLLSALSLLIITGCAVKGDTITLDTSTTKQYPTKQATKNITLSKFTDLRREKPLVATIRGIDNSKLQSVFSTLDMGEWLSTRLQNELNLATIQSGSDSLNISANIKDFYVEYARNPAKTKNLTLTLNVDMIITHNNTTVTRTYSLKQEDYKSFISSSDDLAPFINSSLTELVSSMVKDIVSYSNEH